jgi:hypothetical protein
MSLIPFSVGGATVSVPDATISYTAHAESSTDLTTYTFSSQAIGTAAANRTVIVGMGYHDASAVSISSVTIGGNTSSANTIATDASFGSSFHEYDLTTGTTADIVVTFSGGATRCGIGVWAAYGIGASDDTSNVGGPTEATDINISAGGVAIGHSINHNNTAIAAWTNMTKRFDDIIDYTSHTGADTSSATAVNPTVTCDWTTRDQGPILLKAWPKG